MANEVVTRISADASGFEAGMERVKRASKGFVADQQASARTFEACQKDMAVSSSVVARALEEAASNGAAASVRQVNAAVKGFQKVAETAGKTRFDLMRLKAANLGIAASAEPLIAKAEAASRAMHHLGAGSAAARRELFVLGHEAMQGTWKNFMGSLMVLGERIDVLPMLCGPAGIALGALGASAYVAYHAIHALSEQQEKLDHAMVLSGNYAALTQGKLLVYSDTLSSRVGVSTNDARQALMSLAQSGRVAAADLLQVAEGVAAYAKVSGHSTEDVVRQFEQSYGHAAQAARNWADTHHDLSQAQIEQIRTVEQSGDKAGAWAQFVQAASQRAREAVVSDNKAMTDSYETLGQRWERFWRGVTGKVDELAKLQDAIASQRGMLYDADANPFGTNTEAIEREIAALERRKHALLDQASKADSHKKSVDTLASMMAHHDEVMKSVRSWKEKLDDANASARAAKDAILGVARAAGKSHQELRELGARLDADLKKTIAHNESLYHAPKAQVRASHTDDAARRYLDRLREQAAALRAQMSTTDKLSDAQKELARFNEKMAALKTHAANREEQSLGHAQSAIRLQLERNIGMEKELKLREATAKIAVQALHARESLREYGEEQAGRYARALIGRDADPLRRDEQADLNEITRKHQRELDELRMSASSEVLNSDGYRRAVADVQASLVESIANHDRYYAELRGRQTDWLEGASRGMAEFFKDTQAHAETARHAVVNVMSRMEDAVTKFVTTGKLGVREFVASALADLSKLALHQAMGGIIASLIDRSPTTEVIAQLLKLLPHRAQGGSISGPGTGTSDSIPAMLSDGEYVVNAASARQHHALLEAINSNHLAHFSSGGLAGGSSAVAARSEGAQVHLAVHHHGGSSLSDHDLRALQEWVGVFFDQKLARKMGGQGGVGYLMSQGLLA
ncbi:phage tail length tape measure family protein [Caballeronia sp. GAFFF2]|uniref:phage tail length tape measure family protein n=1 Tax=Caballeronia sp. GAFFF2 TaxID=2921741 RepID=UPI0020292550